MAFSPAAELARTTASTHPATRASFAARSVLRSWRGDAQGRAWAKRKSVKEEEDDEEEKGGGGGLEPRMPTVVQHSHKH